MRKQDANGTWHSGIPSWAELRRMARAGTINQVLSEGDLIPIRLVNGEENAIRVTHDQNGNMFFVFENCLDKPFFMNHYATNSGGWAKSEMRAYLNGEVAKQLPGDLLKSIEPISIEQEMTDKTCVKSRNKLFLLSEKQVFGKSWRSKSEKGDSQLRFFEDSMERKGKESGWKSVILVAPVAIFQAAVVLHAFLRQLLQFRKRQPQRHRRSRLCKQHLRHCACILFA